MKEPAELLDRYPDLAYLMEGCPPTTPIVHSTHLKTPDEYEKQRRSVERRNSNANVIAVLLCEQEVVLVERSGAHAGMALPSGSVHTADKESFFTAFEREVHEEAGIKVVSHTIEIQQIEIRTFVHSETREQQHVTVGTVVGQVVAGATAQMTEAAELEGILSVGTYPVSDLPPLIFNDLARIRDALPTAA